MTPWTIATKLLSPWNSPGKNTGVDSRSTLQWIFPTQGSNPGLVHCRQILYYLSHQGTPGVLIHHSNLSGKTVNALRAKTHVFCRFFTVILSLGPAAAAAAKSLQSCPTLCDRIDGSPPGSPVPGILQARTLEWVAISFSNARK